MDRIGLMFLSNSFVRVVLTASFITPAALFAEEPPRAKVIHANQYRSASSVYRTERAAGVVFGDIESLRNRYTLTEPQLEQIARINRRYKKEHEKWLRLLSPKQVELELLLMEENPDLVKIRVLVQSIGKYTSEIRMNQIAHRLAIERVLTFEQRKRGKEKESVTLPEEHREAPGFPLNLFVPERIVLPLPGILH
ncbi:hypothetical protein LEP1GSC050_3188 [Leptospira broomii serovar Hurstbridge str. 5399]|uniref:Periplasmic heavy metal sensor n=1 Tax=Leptospira broomii serovar Hurstbridge str. 5399 TaxID=1049789 RepID=T0FD52_9LEPT|nr:hypothetical protein [Leptospira broomii]EQA45801.1 hypothetical protein LEP1GSC050_3188 [Leptospira broomii serovar Hurstbridge str. 5399]